MSLIPLTLGTILFDETSLETPEALAAAISVSMAVHEFPGGTITVQTFGTFPDPIKFRGKINRPESFDRILQFKATVAAQQSLQLTFGPFSWIGYVRKFAPVVLHAWRAEYEIEFVPIRDNTLPLQDDGTPSDEQQLGDQTDALNDWQSGIPMALPAPLVAPVASLLTATAAGLANAGGVVASVAPSDATLILASAQAVSDATAPLVSLTDATQAFPAADVAARATIIASIVSGSDVPRWTLNVVNPNLMLLAAQYYGDATQWATIGSANGLTDPQPLGQFQLTIPAAA